MSVCVVIQRKNEIIMASDRAICAEVNGTRERLTGEYQKLWYSYGKLIFCGGSRGFADGLKEYLDKEWDNVTIENIVRYAKAHHDYSQEDRNGIIIGDIVNGETIVTELVSTDDFKPYESKGITDDREYLISALGWKAEELKQKAYGELYLEENTKGENEKTKMNKVLKNAFNSVICTEIGVSLDIYLLYRDIEREEFYKEHNKNRPIQFQSQNSPSCSNVNYPLEDNIRGKKLC